MRAGTVLYRWTRLQCRSAGAAAVLSHPNVATAVHTAVHIEHPLPELNNDRARISANLLRQQRDACVCRWGGYEGLSVANADGVFGDVWLKRFVEQHSGMLEAAGEPPAWDATGVVYALVDDAGDTVYVGRTTGCMQKSMLQHCYHVKSTDSKLCQAFARRGRPFHAVTLELLTGDRHAACERTTHYTRLLQPSLKAGRLVLPTRIASKKYVLPCLRHLLCVSETLKK